MAKNNDDLMAVDLGPVPERLSPNTPPDERQAIEQSRFETNIVRYLMNRYKLHERHLANVDAPADPSGQNLSLMRLCLAFPGFPLFLGAIRVTKTLRERLTFTRLFSEPIPDVIGNHLVDLVTERDAFEDERPVGVLVRWAGFDVYRDPRTRKGVSVLGCSSLLFHGRQNDTFGVDTFQPPVMTVTLPGSDGTKLKVQSFASFVYQIDRATENIFPGARNLQDPD